MKVWEMPCEGYYGTIPKSDGRFSRHLIILFKEKHVFNRAKKNE
jgi:hypothetical protein